MALSSSQLEPSMREMPPLLPCPFCGSVLTAEGPWTRHPPADCMFDGEVVFSWAVPRNITRWNRRTNKEPSL